MKKEKEQNVYYAKVFCSNCGATGDKFNKKIPIKKGTTILNAKCPNCDCDTLHQERKSKKHGTRQN